MNHAKLSKNMQARPVINYFYNIYISYFKVPIYRQKVIEDF